MYGLLYIIDGHLSSATAQAPNQTLNADARKTCARRLAGTLGVGKVCNVISRFLSKPARFTRS